MSESRVIPSVEDGTESVSLAVADVFIHAATKIRLNFQVEDDGQYRTSVLHFGAASKVVIYGGRAEMERLHRLLGQHLEQLDEFEARRVADEDRRREAQASEEGA